MRVPLGYACIILRGLPAWQVYGGCGRWDVAVRAVWVVYHAAEVGAVRSCGVDDNVVTNVRCNVPINTIRGRKCQPN